MTSDPLEPPVQGGDAPSTGDWRAIARAAAAIHALDPWTKQPAAYPFGVEDPETGETGYCLFQRQSGDAPEVLIKVLRGGVGLAMWRDALNQAANNPATGPFLDPNAAQHFLSAAWLPPERMTSNDRALLRELGWALAPGGVYPVFRSKAMGYAPWGLSRADGRLLANVLEQAHAVLPRTFDDPGLLLASTGAEEHVLIRRRQEDEEGEARWIDAWAAPDFPAPAATRPELDQVTAQRLKTSAEQTGDVWEALAQPVSLVAAELAPKRGVPYHPVALLAVDATRNTLLDASFCEFDGWPGELHGFLLTLMEKLRTRPAAISAFPTLEAPILEELCGVLDIDLLPSTRLPQAESAWRRLRQQMAGGAPASDR